MSKRNIRTPQEFNQDDLNGFVMTTKRDLAIAIGNKLTASQWSLWYYLMMIDTPKSIYEIGEKLGLNYHTVSKNIQVLAKKGIKLPDWVEIKTTRNLEKEITDHLHQELGGLREVVTAVGRIDLLTETELIEVKNIKNWKEALGQVLAYSAFYPEHKKRIHLFGKDLTDLENIELSCLTFDVLVTGEVLVNKEV